MPTDLGLIRTDRGRRIEISRPVDAPPATVWDVLTTVACWPAWGPPVAGVDYPHRRIRPDTEGRIRTIAGFWVPFRIETVRDQCWTWTVRGLTPPADGHSVEACGPGRSRAVLELPLWAPWYLPLCWVALRRIAAVATTRDVEGARSP